MPARLYTLNDDDTLTPNATLTTTEQQLLWRALTPMRETFYRLTAAYEREIKQETGATVALSVTPIDSLFVDAEDKDDCMVAAQFLATTTRITWDGTCHQIHLDDGSTDWTAYLQIPPQFSK